MTDLLPVIVTGIASLLLITQREPRIALGAFFLQWVGIAWLVWVSPSGGGGRFSALVEIVAAISTCAVMGLTLFRTGLPGDRNYGAAGSRARRQGPDWILLWGVGALAGVAGYGLARVKPLGVNEHDLLGFFWVALAAVLMLTLEGARSAVKLELGILSLFNAAFLLLYMTGSEVPAVGLLALGALARIGAGMLASYSWLKIGERYDTLNLNALFDSREGIRPGSSSLALAVVEGVEEEGIAALAVSEESEGGEDE
jgi:hypothetical protein